MSTEAGRTLSEFPPPASFNGLDSDFASHEPRSGETHPLAVPLQSVGALSPIPMRRLIRLPDEHVSIVETCALTSVAPPPDESAPYRMATMTNKATAAMSVFLISLEYAIAVEGRPCVPVSEKRRPDASSGSVQAASRDSAEPTASSLIDHRLNRSHQDGTRHAVDMLRLVPHQPRLGGPRFC